jgi:hypothetical protein
MKQRQFPFLFGILLAVALTIYSGVLQGQMRNRWGPSPDTLRAADKLKEIPSQFGDWRLLSTGKLGETAEKMLECAGYIVRNYQNRSTGDLVSVTLLIGPPGPISVHTPEICLPSRNFQALGKREQVAIRDNNGQDDQFWALGYKAGNLSGDLLRVYYAWSAGGRWTAADDPRFKYAGQPYLYKIEIHAPLPPGSDMQADDRCNKFLIDFLPAARKYMIEPSRKN